MSTYFSNHKQMTINNPFSHLNCEFQIRQSKRAKRIGLRIKAPNTVFLTIPYGASIKEAVRFAEEHQEWVASKLKKLELKQSSNQLDISPESNFKTKFHSFEFILHTSPKAFIRITESKTTIHHPAVWLPTDDEMQGLIRMALKETYRQEAKDYLPKRVQELAAQFGFKYNKVSVRDSKARWGSCSGQKNLSLSLWLMKLPYHLIDYILLHELCHTKEMNHGERFHKLLDKVSGGQSKMLNKEVRKYTII